MTTEEILEAARALIASKLYECQLSVEDAQKFSDDSETQETIIDRASEILETLITEYSA